MFKSLQRAIEIKIWIEVPTHASFCRDEGWISLKIDQSGVACVIRVARIQIGRTNDFVDEFIGINSEINGDQERGLQIPEIQRRLCRRMPAETTLMRNWMITLACILLE